jgi:thioredoxin-like negative regulator of GroEL
VSADRVLSAFRLIFSKQSAGILAVFLAVPCFAGAARAAPIAWQKDIRMALRTSSEEGKPLMVMVGAGWCGYCYKMLQQTFPDPALALRVNGQFVPVLIDADEQAELVQKLRVDAMPTVLVISPERRIVGRFAGFQTAAQLAARLARFQRTRPAPAPMPMESKPAFHQRAWSAIQAAAPRGTLEAAKDFSASRRHETEN